MDRRNFLASLVGIATQSKSGTGVNLQAEAKKVRVDLSVLSSLEVAHKGQVLKFTSQELWYLAEYMRGLMPHIAEAYKGTE